MDRVDYLVLDEACQAIEPATLIPMQLKPRRVVMVGDHRQLPATTFSPDAERSNLSRSLFERLVNAGLECNMLQTQYRMHPRLAAFPSHRFYEGRLQNADSVLKRDLPSELSVLDHTMQGRRLLFIDLARSKEHTDSSNSKSNSQEAAVTAGILKLFKKTKSDVGVITPYKSQVRLLKSRAGRQVEINTVDAFQGREKKVILFNCVRSNGMTNTQASLGFLTDMRRLNVAITRPQHFLIIIGNAATLAKHKVWADLISHC